MCLRRVTSGMLSLDSQVISQIKRNAALGTCVQVSSLSRASFGKQVHGEESVTTQVLSPESSGSQILQLM